MIQDKLRKLKGIQIENIPKDDITRSTKIMENLTQNPVIIHREEKSKTKVEISINGNRNNVNWLKIYKPSKTITLSDIKKLLWKQPKMYGLSSGVRYRYRVKTTEDGQVGFEDVDSDYSILPIFQEKIVLQCWSQ